MVKKQTNLNKSLRLYYIILYYIILYYIILYYIILYYIILYYIILYYIILYYTCRKASVCIGLLSNEYYVPCGRQPEPPPNFTPPHHIKLLGTKCNSRIRKVT